MNTPRNKSNPTTRVAALIVVVVVLVIATLLYNAIKGKHEYDEQNAAASQIAAPAAAVSLASSPAAASQ
jgi:flagellar basal body-associated protein FliL